MNYYYFMEVYWQEYSARTNGAVQRCKTFRYSTQRALVMAYKAYSGMLSSRITGCKIYGPAQELSEGLK